MYDPAHPTCRSCQIGCNPSAVVDSVPLKKKGNLTLILPFKLPTWNQLLAMDHWQRKKVRDWIKRQVSECIASGVDWQTPTGSARRLLLTDLCLREYSEMITPNALKKYRTLKSKAKLKKP